MHQDQESGAAGDTFGTETAPLIAKAIGATMVGAYSNEANYLGERVVIKCAGRRTTSVGVTYLMLKRLKKVIAAFQLDNGSFEVFALPAATYQKEMRPTKSQGASAGRVGIVSKRLFVTRGQRIGSTKI